jgi:hypothetical protein
MVRSFSTGADVPVAVPQSHPQPSRHHQEELVLGVVVVPDELPAQLHDLHVHVVDVADDLRRPRVREAPERLPQIHHAHGAPPGIEYK